MKAVRKPITQETIRNFLLNYIQKYPHKSTYFSMLKALKCYFKRYLGPNITPKVLRDWFCCQMGELGVPDRYIDAFGGRVPKSTLARR